MIMEKTLSKNLFKVIKEGQVEIAPFYKVEKIIEEKKISGFHEWVDYKELHGAFLIRRDDGKAYWLLLIDWKMDDTYYLVLMSEKRSNLYAQIHQVEKGKFGNQLVWKYSPNKWDELNKERKKYFTNYYGDTRVTIDLPNDKNDVEDFLDELFSLVENRIKAEKLDTELPSLRDGFPEGKLFERIHKKRERNQKLVQLVKQQEMDAKGRLECKVCGFCFEDKYGELGEGFIEAHHMVPLSEMDDDGGETRIEDIILVCSNCHKMIHLKRPWLRIEEIKSILVKVEIKLRG